MYPVRTADLPEFDVNIHGRSTCACVCTRARIIVADEPWRGTACVYTAGFKRPNIFRALKLLTGVGVVGYSALKLWHVGGSSAHIFIPIAYNTDFRL